MRRDLLRRRLRAIQKSIGASSFVRCSPVSLVLHSVTVEYTHTRTHIINDVNDVNDVVFPYPSPNGCEIKFSGDGVASNLTLCRI